MEGQQQGAETSAPIQNEKTSAKGLLVVFCFLITIALALVVGIIWARNNRNTAGPQESGSSQQNGNPIDDSVPSEFADIDSYIKEMDTKIASAETDEQKAELYSERAKYLSKYTYLSGDKSYIDELLSNATMADQLSPSTNSIYYLYVLEKEYGSSEKAEEYYKTLNERSQEEGIDVG